MPTIRMQQQRCMKSAKKKIVRFEILKLHFLQMASGWTSAVAEAEWHLSFTVDAGVQRQIESDESVQQGPQRLDSATESCAVSDDLTVDQLVAEVVIIPIFRVQEHPQFNQLGGALLAQLPRFAFITVVITKSSLRYYSFPQKRRRKCERFTCHTYPFGMRVSLCLSCGWSSSTARSNFRNLSVANKLQLSG